MLTETYQGLLVVVVLDRYQSPDYGNTDYNGNDRQHDAPTRTAFPHSRVECFQPLQRTLQVHRQERTC